MPTPTQPADTAPVLTDDQHQRIDMALHADKLAGGPQRRNFDAAMRLQIARQDSLAGGVL